MSLFSPTPSHIHCAKCNTILGWDWTEPEHDCDNPMFDINGNYIWRENAQ